MHWMEIPSTYKIYYAVLYVPKNWAILLNKGQLIWEENFDVFKPNLSFFGIISKGQIISKGLLDFLEFSQKTKKPIRCSKIFKFLNHCFARLQCWKKCLEFMKPTCWINGSFAGDTFLRPKSCKTLIQTF